MRKLYLLLFTFLPLLVQAQSRVTAPTAVWPEMQVSYGVGEGGLLFVRNQYRINTDSRFNDLRSSGLLSGFERVELTLGYEQELTEHWRGGAILRYAAEDFPKSLFYTLFVRHNGNLSSLYFNKQLMFEYVDQEEQEAFGRYRLMAELGKRLPLHNTFVTPAISYEAALLSAFGRSDNTAEERFIDRTRLQVNLTFELMERLRITPYFMRQTDYYYVMISPVYDEQGQLVQDGYTTRRNRISPVAGLELKYTLNRATNTASITY